MNRYFSIALSALTTGAFAMGLGTAPAANASCVSAFGFGNSAECTSGPTTIAIAIGSSAIAHADGVLGMAVALGNGADAGIFGVLESAIAVGGGSIASAGAGLDFSFALGNNAKAEAGAPGEYANVAIALGHSDTEAYGGNGNLAVNMFGQGSQVYSLGTGNVAVNTGNSSTVQAFGKFSNATNLGGSSVFVATSFSSVAGWVFNVLGKNNIVQSDKGPLAIAGSLFQTNGVVKQLGTGININGHVVGGAAATPAAAKHTATGLAAGKRKHTAK